ncbi:uncharacterized protein LOC120270922 [Dioscorea cayenensis subsp. rotundata]|uniref:Uncharacterized protein LOC120270922 n=1 Tax=Dioscorea cayennensis subsp. rotundata TaxID=55577 RepID=A0AB40C2S3_DIOCR|nr:uncharacterized protein LOC120270922 [Dioscorea cayenensis subsp. rotundata]
MLDSADSRHLMKSVEEYLRHLIDNHCTGDRNEMALLPEGITDLLRHEMLSVPLVELSETLSRLCLDYPDLSISCHRKARTGPLIINFTGKDQMRVELAVKVVSQKYHGAFSEFNFEGVLKNSKGRAVFSQ